MLTNAQMLAIKNDILFNSDLNTLPNTLDGAFDIAKLYNLDASPEFWVWRTAVSRAEIYNTTSPDNTNWNWTTYKNQGVGEQNAWTQMFMGDQADFSKTNLRAGISAIFGAVNPQTTHCLSMGKRRATRIEKLLANGTGSLASPATMQFEGPIDYNTVNDARNMNS